MRDNLFVKKIDDWVYLCLEERQDISCYNKNIYRVNENVTGMIKIVEGCASACIIGKYIYYTICDFIDDDGIYRVNLDGSGKVKICSDSVGCENFHNGWIYYCSLSLPDDFSIYKVKIDGSERIRLNKDKCSDVLVHGEWVYYINVDEGSIPYKMRLDGSEKTRLSDMSSHGLYLKEVVCGSIFTSILLE